MKEVFIVTVDGLVLNRQECRDITFRAMFDDMCQDILKQIPEEVLQTLKRTANLDENNPLKNAVIISRYLESLVILEGEGEVFFIAPPMLNDVQYQYVIREYVETEKSVFLITYDNYLEQLTEKNLGEVFNTMRELVLANKELVL